MLRDQVTFLLETQVASHCPQHLHGSFEFFPRLRRSLSLGLTFPSDASVWNSSAVSLRSSYTCTMRCDHTDSSQLLLNSESTSFLTAPAPSPQWPPHFPSSEASRGLILLLLFLVHSNGGHLFRQDSSLLPWRTRPSLLPFSLCLVLCSYVLAF